MEGEMLLSEVSFGGIFQDQIDWSLRGHFRLESGVKGKKNGWDLLCEFFFGWWDFDDILEWVLKWVFYEIFLDEIELEVRFKGVRRKWVKIFFKLDFLCGFVS
jgi:hypothetical protein